MTVIVDRLTDLTAEAIANIARSACQSRTLRQALTVVRTPEGFVLRVPHYWAPYFHDGRGVVTARPGGKLVFYKNPADDPRIRGGYPVKLSDVRRLTKAEFYRDLKAGKLIVTDSVGPAPPHEFMGDSLTARAGPIVAQASLLLAKLATQDALGPLLNASVRTQL